MPDSTNPTIDVRPDDEDSIAPVANVALTGEDAAAYMEACSAKAGLSAINFAVLLLFVVCIFLAGPLQGVLENQFGLPWPSAFVMSLGAGLLLAVAISQFTMRSYWRNAFDKRGLFLRSHTILLSQNGVRFRSDVADLKYDWAAFVEINETPSYCYLYTDRAAAYVVPKRSFASSEEAAKFCAVARERIRPTEQEGTQ